MVRRKTHDPDRRTYPRADSGSIGGDGWMNLQKVYQEEDYGMDYGQTKVGLRVDDRIIWFATWNYPTSDNKEQMERFRKMESLLDEIVQKCGKK